MRYDKDARSITISDNGIGLSREEAVANLGTIARSGTREFFSQLTGDKQKDAQLIGQFGVGLFFVHRGRQGHRGQPSRRRQRRDPVGIRRPGRIHHRRRRKASRGTDVTLHLRADEDELLNGWKLREILRRYSDHISLPIRMQKEEWDQERASRSRPMNWKR